MRVPENLVASQSLALAKQEHERWLAENRDQIGRASDGASVLVLHEDLTVSLPANTEELTRPAFAAYFLFESAGVTKLVQSLKQCSQPRNMPSIGFAKRAPQTYFASFIGLFALVFIVITAWIGSVQRGNVGRSLSDTACIDFSCERVGDDRASFWDRAYM